MKNIDKALEQARGCFQRALVLGRASIRELKGKASKYSAKYCRSYRALVARLEEAGVDFVEVRGPRGGFLGKLDVAE